MITIDEVKAAIAKLADDARAYDAEALHIEEDNLRHAVLQAIADGAPNAVELATEALKTSNLDFARWYA